VLPVTAPEHSVRPSAVVVIPARYESSRFPGKPLALIAGRPMIEHVYRRAAAARAIARVIVATDDQRIADAVEAFGGEAVMTSAAHPTGTDRLAEVASGLDCEIVVNVQGDEPLIPPALIDQVARLIESDRAAGMATLMTPLVEPAEYTDPNVAKVVVSRDGAALYFSRSPIPASREGGVPAEARRHIGLYAYRVGCLKAVAAAPVAPAEHAERLEQLRALWLGQRIAIADAVESPARGVDTGADLEQIRRIVARRAGQGGR
jgi:3-deoxy-manno-octulosonate cytidylyltransferase (CMP-KDO synthetase)